MVWSFGNSTVYSVGGPLLVMVKSYRTDNIFRALTNRYKESGLSVYINADGPDVYEDKVYQIATAKTGSFDPTLILVGIRLGIDRITPAYWQALKASLQMSQSVGIAGYIHLQLDIV